MTLDKEILAILESEHLPPSEYVSAMCAKIKDRHQGRVQAFLYYGSSLRAMNDPAKMLDFYVLVDSYRKTHKNPLRAVLNALIPPAVYYLENENTDGSVSTCKYSIISLGAFERKNTKRALLSMVWGRFSQPCILLFPESTDVRARIQAARINAVKHIARLTAPLMEPKTSAIDFWARAYFQSYNTELRPEKSNTRTREIVSRYSDRYDALSAALFGAPDNNELYAISPDTGRFKCRAGWALRRFIGKPMNAVRVLNSAFTFDGGVEYALHKVKSHSGVSIDLTPSQRKHPVLWSPVLAWKLMRGGAFK